MYSLTINPDRSAAYTRMVGDVQTTYCISSDAFIAMMSSAPSGVSWWDGLAALLDAHVLAE